MKNMPVGAVRCARFFCQDFVAIAHAALISTKCKFCTAHLRISGLVLIALLYSPVGIPHPWGTPYTITLDGVIHGGFFPVLEYHSGTINFDSPYTAEFVPGDPFLPGIAPRENDGLYATENATVNPDGMETISINVRGAQEYQVAPVIFDNRLFDPDACQVPEPVYFDVTGLYWTRRDAIEISNVSLSLAYIDPSFNRLLDSSTDYSLFVSGSGTSADPLSMHFEINPLVFQDPGIAFYNATNLHLEFVVNNNVSDAGDENVTESNSISKECSDCPEDQAVTLTWDRVLGEILGYRVFRGDNATSATELVADVPTTSITLGAIYDLGLQSGDSICFRVKAYNSTEESDYSNAVCGSL